MTTAWYSSKISEEILKTNFPPLQNSNHFTALDNCLQKIDPEYRCVLDLGCCKAEFADACPQFDYCGADLPNIIEGVSKKIRPGLTYMYFDANKDDYNFMSKFDIILMNGFLSELTEPIYILDKILSNMKKYAIIHRQDIDKFDGLQTYGTYGNLATTNSIISRDSLNKTVEKNNSRILFETNSFDNQIDTKRTLLITND